MRILPVLSSCGIGISPDPARPAGNEDVVAAATIKSKQNLRHPFHRIEQAMPARSLASAMARTLWCSRFLVASRHGLRPVLSDTRRPETTRLSAGSAAQFQAAPAADRPGVGG